MAPDPSNPFTRDPAYMPSEHSRRSIAKAAPEGPPMSRVVLLLVGLFAVSVVMVAGMAFFLRRLAPLVALAAALSLAGCGTDEIREKKLQVALDEIAILGSMAQTPGDRSPEHVSAINEKTKAVQSHVVELAK